MREWESFDEVHVISDLHLGGPRGREIFRQEAALAGWIQTLGTDDTRQVALVINGDIFDFIARYPEGTYLDPLDAVDQLDALLGGTGTLAEKKLMTPLPALCAALRALLGRPNCRLVLVIGNHDVELTLTSVRERLLHWLCDHGTNGKRLAPASTSPRRGRVRVALSDQGWRCKVGGRHVYCVHGNAVDPENTVHFEGLRRVDCSIERGEDGPDQLVEVIRERWNRSAGTALVVDILNEVKERHPFVDRLKPEGLQLLGILARFDLGFAQRKAWDLVGILPDAVRGRAQGAVLGADPERPRRVRKTGGARRPTSTRARGERRTFGEIDLVRLQQMAADGVDPMTLVDAGTLGFMDFVRGVRDTLIGSGDHLLWESIRTWPDRTGLETLDAPDAPLRLIGPRVGREVDILVASHTHAPRAVFAPAHFVYFNTGTWIDLLRFPADLFDRSWSEASEPFRRFIDELKSADPATLANYQHTKFIGTALSIKRVPSGSGGVVRSTLWNVVQTLSGPKRPPPLAERDLKELQ